MKMICIHHAGGSVYSFSKFKRNLSGHYDVIPIELPGRGVLINEALTTDCSEAIEILLKQLKKCVEPYEDYMLFGHSMGAWLAYGICCELKNSKGYSPCHLILSGNNPPFSIHEQFTPYDYSDEEFIERLLALGGIPDKLLNNKELLNYYISVLRADYELIYNFPDYIEKMTIDCGVTVIKASDDSIVNNTISEWKEITEKDFEIVEIDGDHFSIYDKMINDVLKKRLFDHNSKSEGSVIAV